MAFHSTTHPNCCGVTPITAGISQGGKSTDPSDADLQKLIGIVQGQSEDPNKHSNRMFEIILNDKQAKGAPKLLKLMAALGFVFVGRMNNGNHDSWVNIFQRYQRNGRDYVKPPFEWSGFEVAQVIADHQVAPVVFKRAEVPNPFSQAPKQFDLRQFEAVIKA